MVKDPDDIIVRTVARFMIPIIQLFSLYVYVHGHISPGGGFQGGCILAASFILISLAFNIGEAKKILSGRKNLLFIGLGVFIYAFTGLVPLFVQGNFLDYQHLSQFLPLDPVMARYYGVALVELGVQITVMAVMISLFQDLVTAGRHESILKDRENGIDR
ncbi:MAG: Na(+)/H(+) antiporter subunit B [Syntrophales bacterium]|nr:Na(+)/H(+) antiporter subunit B [Syntrophales bacterium]